MLALYRVQIRYGISISHIDREHLVTDDSGKAGFLPYETAVIATSMKPVLPEFVSKIHDAYPRTFLIGDCVQARGIGDAILEGYKVSSIL